MSILPVANNTPTPDPVKISTDTNEPKPKRPKKKNLGQIHARPLPLEAHPLPAFHPSNPISLLRLAYSWISDVLFPPSSHPARNYVGYFSPETRSVHVTDPRCARVLWEMGFFGKGTLSRSEPSWLEREQARLQQERDRLRGRAAEDVTNARREERRLFKLERARLEWEKIEKQRMVEEGGLDVEGAAGGGLELEFGSGTEESSSAMEDGVVTLLLNETQVDGEDDSVEGAPNGSIEKMPKLNGYLQAPTSDETVKPSQSNAKQTSLDQTLDAAEDEDEEHRGRRIDNQEHLQLTLEESFFLSYGLGVLSVYPPKRRDPSPLSVKTKPHQYSTTDLLELFCQYSSFPPADSIWITPDDQFLLNYVAYHHFRSLGWVVRPGIKFSVDYLLYNRGPAFSHAEFAVLIIPAYTDRYWNTPGGRARRRVYEQKDWWWLHCVNRVQSHVFKTLVLCYIDIPSELDLDFDEGIDIGKLLRSYKVREFVVRRWLANRSRD